MASSPFFCLAFLIALSFSTFNFAIGARSLLATSDPVEQSLFKPILGKPKFHKIPILPKFKFPHKHKFPVFPPKFSKPLEKPFPKPIPKKPTFLGFPKFKFPPKFKHPPLETTQHVGESLFKPIPGVSKYPDVKTFPKFKIPEKKFPPKFKKLLPFPPKFTKPFEKPCFGKPKFPPLSHKISNTVEQPLSTTSPKTSGDVKQSLFPSIPGVPRLPDLELPPLPVTPIIPGSDLPLVPGLPLTPPSSAAKATAATKSNAP